jgi:hypothetical protein
MMGIYCGGTGVLSEWGLLTAIAVGVLLIVLLLLIAVAGEDES